MFSLRLNAADVSNVVCTRNATPGKQNTFPRRDETDEAVVVVAAADAFVVVGVGSQPLEKSHYTT